MSAAGHDYYPEIGIPRAKLMKSANQQRATVGLATTGTTSTTGRHQLDAAHLQSYLDDGTGVRIPRVRLSDHSGSLERDAGSAEMFTAGNHHHHRALVSASSSYDTTSESSSDYTVREEVERRVITDVTKSEIRKTTTADVHGAGGGQQQQQLATAEFHVYPPMTNENRKVC